MPEITILEWAALIYGVIIVAFWLFLYLKGSEDTQLFEGLNDKDYPFHEMYCVGYQVTKMLQMSYKSKRDRQLRKELASLYEAKYAEYYIRVVYAQRITMALFMLAFAAPLFFLSGSAVLFGVMLAGSVAAYIYYGKATKDLIEKKKEEYFTDFSDVVSKLALLVNSGMILVEAWKMVAYSANRPIFLEMQKSVEAMENGSSASDAINEFGRRCMLQEIRKFTSTLIQGMKQGNIELSSMLMQQSREVWQFKKQQVLREGELADTKLLVPMCITFIGILIMIIVPIFSNLGM